MLTPPGESQNFAYVAGLVRDEPQKSFAYKVYDSDRNLIGEYLLNVTNEPATFKQNVNTLHSNMAIDLAQNDNSVSTTMPTRCSNEDDVTLTTEADEDLIIDLTATLSGGRAGQ